MDYESLFKDLNVTELGSDKLFEGENFDQVDAKTFLLDGGAARKFIDDQPFLPELYDYLEEKGLAYRHEWKPRQLLVVSNTGPMLHGRCPSRSQLPAENPDNNRTNMWRQWLYWNGESVTDKQPRK